MKRKIILLAALWATTLDGSAQAPTLQWETIEGGSGYDEGSGITKAPDGYIYVCGWFASPFSFGGIQVNPPATGEASFVAKLRTDSTVVWAKAYGGAGYLQDIAVGTDGSIYVTGTGMAQAVLYIAKIDSMMNTNWVYTSSAGDNPGSGSWYPTNVGKAIMLDHGGNIITCGTFTDSLSIDTAVLRAGTGSTTIGYALKLDPAGHVIWARKGKDGGDGFSVAVDQSDNAYFGYSYRDFNSSYTFTADIDKFSASGNKLWEATFKGVEQTLIVTDNNNIPYVTAHLRDTALIGATSYTPTAYEETALVKMDAASGNELWIKNFVGVPGISGSNFAFSTGYSPQLGVVVYAYGPITINSVSYTGQNLFSFNSSGNINWTLPSMMASLNDMSVDQGDLYVEGHKSINSNNNDIFTARLSQGSTGIGVRTASTVRFYPNPTRNRLVIETANTTENIQINLFNALGEKVKEINAKGRISEPVDLKPGIYFLQYNVSGKVFVDKLAVE